MPLSQLSTEALNQIAEVGYALVFPVLMHQPFANLLICLMEDMPEYAAKRSPVVNLSCTGRNLLLGGQSATTEVNWVTGNLIVQFWQTCEVPKCNNSLYPKRLTLWDKVDMAKPTKDDKTRRRAVKAARKVDKERAKQTRQEHVGKEAFGQAAAGIVREAPEEK